MAQRLVRVIFGTGAPGIQQVTITGASGGLSRPQWAQLTAAQAIQGPTGTFLTVQAMNTGASGGQENKTVQIVGYAGPA